MIVHVTCGRPLHSMMLEVSKCLGVWWGPTANEPLFPIDQRGGHPRLRIHVHADVGTDTIGIALTQTHDATQEEREDSPASSSFREGRRIIARAL